MERLVPLSDVAYELNISTRDLERRCNGGLVFDELGLRCIPGSLVRELLAQRGAERERQRQKHIAEREEHQRQKQSRQREREARDRLHEKQAAMPIHPLSSASGNPLRRRISRVSMTQDCAAPGRRPLRRIGLRETGWCTILGRRR